jgi:peptidoglycan/LPS O-acetylase OafA/YrhL
MNRTAPPAAARTGLIRSLVGIRGVLSGAVVLVHVAPFAMALVPSAEILWRALWHHLYWVLDLFFVLSGFVVTTGYRTRFARWPGPTVYGRFLWARLARFYPVHIAVLAALVAAVLLTRAIGIEIPHSGDLGGDVIRNVALVQGWGWSDGLSWNGPTWSLSAEWFCYLIMPVIVPLVLRFRRPSTVVAGYCVAMAVPLTVYSVIGFGDPQITYVAPLFRAVGEFVAGALLCQLGHVGSRIPELAGRLTGLILAALASLLVVLATAGVSLLFAVPVAGLLVLGLAQQRGAVDRALSGRRVLAAGELSVSLFLTHVPWLMASSVVVTPARFPGAWGFLGVGIVLAGSVGVAGVTYVLVEAPAQRWMSRVARPGRHGARAASA